MKSIGGPEIFAALQQIDGKVVDVSQHMLSTSKLQVENLREIDSKISVVSDDAKSTAKMMTELVTGLDSNICAVRAVMKSSVEQITESISSQFKVASESMNKIRQLVFMAIGVSTLALIVGVTILIKNQVH